MNAIILCAPRSGAAWTTRLLRSCGLPATHEVLFRPEPPRPAVMPDNWIEASWCAVPFAAAVQADVKVHLIRNPLHVVRSIMRIELFDRPLDPFVRLARDHTDCWQDRTPLANTCEMLARWYDLATPLCAPKDVYRVENATDIWCLAKRVGSAITLNDFLRRHSEMPDRVNQRGDSSADAIMWDDINQLCPRLIDFAAMHGYL